VSLPTGSAGASAAAAAADFTRADRAAMARALELAARGLYTTDPNPRVGCVLRQGEQTVGEGWHERAGGPHAEVVALRAAGAAARGATAYVTLEPCAHHGRTPPCVDALIAAGVKRVVFALQDPNPRVDGRGAERLHAAGIQVASGLLAAEACELNPGFLQRMSIGRPFVRLKLAMSLDGRTALASGASHWITGAAAREDVQHWRARSAAILTGIGTVLADDPRLTVRGRDTGGRQPLRIVLDSSLRTPLGAQLLREPGKTWIAYTAAAADASAQARAAALAHQGVQLEQLDARDGRLDLPALLRRLAAAQVNELLVEAGATLAGELLRQQLVDEWLLYAAPILLGPQARPLIELPLLSELRAAPRFIIHDTEMLGADLRLRLRPEGSTCSPASSRT